MRVKAKMAVNRHGTVVLEGQEGNCEGLSPTPGHVRVEWDETLAGPKETDAAFEEVVVIG